MVLTGHILLAGTLHISDTIILVPGRPLDTGHPIMSIYQHLHGMTRNGDRQIIDKMIVTNRISPEIITKDLGPRTITTPILGPTTSMLIPNLFHPTATTAEVASKTFKGELIWIIVMLSPMNIRTP